MIFNFNHTILEPKYLFIPTHQYEFINFALIFINYQSHRIYVYICSLYVKIESVV